MSPPLSVLIVEDEAILALQLESLLVDAGYEVAGWALTADDAKEQVDRLRPDISFVDIHLADGPTGIEVARHVLAGEAGSRVVFLTANARRVPDDLTDAIGVISKPYTTSGLLSTLRYLEEGVRRPPPKVPLPAGLMLFAKYAAAWAG